jgi:hypothetical protein
MDWLKKLFGGVQNAVNSDAYGTAEKIGFWGQFAVDGAGKYESAMNGVKAAATGDIGGALAGIAGFMVKKNTEEQEEGTGFLGRLWNRAKSNVFGEAVEGLVSWVTKSFGAVGILAVLAIGFFFFKPLKEMFGSLFGGDKKEEVSQNNTPNTNERQIAGDRGQGQSNKVDMRAAVRDNADELARLGYQVNAQGDVKNVNGQQVAPDAAINHLIQQQQAVVGRGTPA